MKSEKHIILDRVVVCDSKMISKRGVYTITSKVNGKIYVGSTIKQYGFKCRWLEHITELINNKHYNTYLQNHVNKYGIDDLEFDVLEECQPKYAINIEHYWINILNSVNDGFNLKYPASQVSGKNHFNYKNLDKYADEIINSYLFDKVSLGFIGEKYGVKAFVIKRILQEHNIPIIRHESRIDYRDVYNEYINSWVSISELAVKYGVNKTSIRNNFKLLKLPFRIDRARNECQLIYDRYLNGERLTTIADDYKIDSTSILNIFKENSLKTLKPFRQLVSYEEVLRMYEIYKECGNVKVLEKQYSMERSTFYRLFQKYNLKAVDKRIKHEKG